MRDDEEILDNDLHLNKPQKSTTPFNYFKYSFSYIFLMIMVSFFLSKYQQRWDSRMMGDVTNAFSLISIAIVFSLIKEGLSLFYWNVFSSKHRPQQVHPMWFRVLETCFYCWCVLIIAVLIGYFMLR